MPKAILIKIGKYVVEAELNDSKTAGLIYDALPYETDFSTWGDEIYFSTPVKADSENEKEVVDAGEIAYWPPGRAFCIFWGPTPASFGNEIRPASPVNPLGKIKGNSKIFNKLVKESEHIKLEKV